MATVRAAGTKLRGNPIEVQGEELQVGQKAPDFTLVGQDLGNVTLADTAGKVRIISTVTSIDTPNCAVETRRWQQEANKLGDKVEIITISMDLPSPRSAGVAKRASRTGCCRATATSSSARTGVF